ncbi:MAG: hypothetical protein ACFFD4_17770 [Candidatus Odinarchaeota archaeon]
MVDQDSLTEALSHSVTANVFIYLRFQEQPVGVREVQRELNLGSSSTAHWHLTKLLEKGIIEKLPDNRYRLVEPYAKIRKIPVFVALDHYFVGKKTIPGIFVLISFLFTCALSLLAMIIVGLWLQAAITGLIGLTVTILLIIQFYRRIRLEIVTNSEKNGH